MSGPEFFQTLMGKRYYEGTLPSLIKAINELNETLRVAFVTDKAKDKVEDEPEDEAA